LANIHAVGFRQPVNLFSEKEPPIIADNQRCKYVVHHYSGKDVGNFRNWRRAAMWAYANTNTKWYLFMEDDIAWCANGYKHLKAKLSGIDSGSAKTRRDSLGMLSCYTSPAMVPPVATSNGWYDARYYGAVEGFWGALAMCMTRESLGALLEHPRFVGHESTYQIDYVVGEVFRNLMDPKLAVRIHVPSLVEHTGEYSTIFSDADIKAGGVDVLRRGYKFNEDY
jgi:hypothetical protein